MKPEERARQLIDAQLKASGWEVQDLKDLDLSAGRGVAVREFPLQSGFADYLLFVDGKAAGVLEAKPAGTTLSGVAEQTTKYLVGLPPKMPQAKGPLPFAYESTGDETFFRDERDPSPCSRRVFSFHRPETLAKWLSLPQTLRAGLASMPPILAAGLRDCQFEALTNLEASLAQAKPRSLVQMATGSGKTFLAVSAAYRWIKHADARRVLFLVDRNTLGKQTYNEFQQYVTPDDGRKFTELYNIQHMTSNKLDPVSNVCITTIQRLYSMLRGEAEFDAESEERSWFDGMPVGRPREVSYAKHIPIETFDFIITDECHRSIYHDWRQVLEYFDAFIVGLTATPSKQTLGFFHNNLVMEYTHERAVADGVNVGYNVYRIRTEITEAGNQVDAGDYVDKRDKRTRKVRWEQLDEDLEYDASQLDRAVVAVDQIRTVVRTFRDRLFSDIFPGRTEVPKTLIFAKDDSHAEDIVHIVREEFGKGNEFCKKITYRTTGEKTDDLIASLRNAYHPRIAVTVDMISTGTDVKPLECLIFIRDVRSSSYFEQMKGRGTRVLDDDAFRAVTPDALHKTRFVIVDAVGACESDKTESRPLERKPGLPFDKLLQDVALGARDVDTLTSLAGRLAQLDRTLTPADRAEVEAVGGQSIKTLIHGLLDAFDPDKQAERAGALFGVGTPTPEQVEAAGQALADAASAPFNRPRLRNLLVDIKHKNEQVLDGVSQDKLIFSGYDVGAKDKARAVVETFKRFIQENRDELTALQMIYSQPYGRRHWTYEQIRELARAIEKPPYSLSAERVWAAYEQLEASKVHGAGPQRLLTDMVSLLRYAVGEADELAPFAETVDERFARWLAEQERAGRRFTAEQREWLEMMKGHIATSLSVGIEDFELPPFYERGGPAKVYQVFGPQFGEILAQLNEALAA